MKKLNTIILLAILMIIPSIYCEFPANNDGAASSPVFLLIQNQADNTLSLKIYSTTKDALIYYTTDSTDPDKDSLLYTDPIMLTKTISIKAIAVKDGMGDSNIAGFEYMIELPPPAVSNPLFTPAAGAYNSSINVEITSPTEGASIYYTTDGTGPSKESALYSGPIPLTESATLKAIAVKDGMTNSDIISAEYIIEIPTPIIEVIISELDPVLRGFDIRDTIPVPALTGMSLGTLGDYSLYVQHPSSGLETISITETDGGLHCLIEIPNFAADLKAYKTCDIIMLPPDCIGPDNINGDLEISSILMSADVAIETGSENNIVSYVITPSVTFEDPEFSFEASFDTFEMFVYEFLDNYQEILKDEMTGMIESVFSE